MSRLDWETALQHGYLADSAAIDPMRKGAKLPIADGGVGQVNVEVQGLEPGMCLSHDVVARGRVLLKAGMPLSEKHIHMLVRWEIESVEIAGDDAAPSSRRSVSPEDQLERLRELAVPFEQDPQMQLLLASVHMVLEERVD